MILQGDRETYCSTIPNRTNYKYHLKQMPSSEGGTNIEGKCHKDLTGLAFDLFDRVDDIHLAFRDRKDAVVEESEKTDCKKDLELVKVRRWNFLGGRNDPHRRGWFLFKIFQDIRFYQSNEFNIMEGVVPDLYWTALNHYIDVRGGPGNYDDYDGYSFNHGSAHSNQRELAQRHGNVGIDTVINTLLSGFYVHAPGRPWYDGCSESVRWYSRYSEGTTYSSVEEEARARFPTAVRPPRMNTGVPESVFFPVDNIAKHWYDRLTLANAAECLGYVMHALQDAAVPHHAAGCAGNFHTTYEERQIGEIGHLVQEQTFADEVLGLFEDWRGTPGGSPARLSQGDHGRTPGIKWEVDMLATWLAVNAYKEFKDAYRGFEGGSYIHDTDSMRGLALKAGAISMLALAKADDKV